MLEDIVNKVIPAYTVMLVCARCKLSLDESGFYRCARKKNGYNSWCKECSIAFRQTPEQIEKSILYRNKPEVRARKSAYEKTPEYKAKRRTYNSRKLTYKKTVYEQNKNDDPVLFRAKFGIGNMKKRAKKNQCPVDLEYFTVQRLIDMHKESDVCPCCFESFDFSINSNDKYHSPSLDRIVPEFGYVKGNVNVICYRCNLVKNDSTAMHHMQIVRYMQKHQELIV